MRKISTLIAAITIVATGWAQSPQKISYQAVIRNAGGALVTTQVGMRISILKGTDTGTPVYVEALTPTPNVNGLVTIEIGAGTPVTGTIAGINWSDGPYFIKTETDPAGGVNYSIIGTAELLSVPYALYARSSGERYIGELYGGGIIVSVWKKDGVEHGLIASLVNIQPDLLGVPWSNVLEPTDGRSPIDGQANTNAIITQAGHTASAAKLCADYSVVVDGVTYDDWYLPSIYELNKIYQAALIVNKILPMSGELSFKVYWSSTEADQYFAYYHGFHTNIVGSNLAKGSLAYVRAVRVF